MRTVVIAIVERATQFGIGVAADSHLNACTELVAGVESFSYGSVRWVA
jgi:hypothetical protein